MGAIKPVFIKRTAHKLMAQSPEKFSTSFEENKKAVSALVESGKCIRNRVAGYISRQMLPKNPKKYRPVPESARRANSRRPTRPKRE